MANVVVKLVSHNYSGLALSVKNTNGEPTYVEFSDGYAVVDEPSILRQLFDSPLRGPGRPAEFMFLASDDQIRGIIDGASASVAKGTQAGPSGKADLSGLTLPQAIDAVLKADPSISHTFHQLAEALLDGGYKTSSAAFAATIVPQTVRQLAKDGKLSYDGTYIKAN